MSISTQGRYRAKSRSVAVPLIGFTDTSGRIEVLKQTLPLEHARNVSSNRPSRLPRNVSHSSDSGSRRRAPTCGCTSLSQQSSGNARPPVPIYASILSRLSLAGLPLHQDSGPNLTPICANPSNEGRYDTEST